MSHTFWRKSSTSFNSYFAAWMRRKIQHMEGVSTINAEDFPLPWWRFQIDNKTRQNKSSSSAARWAMQSSKASTCHVATAVMCLLKVSTTHLSRGQMHGSKEKQKERKEETRKQGKMDTHVETNTWYMGPTSLLEFWMFQNKFGPHLCVCTITRNSKLS